MTCINHTKVCQRLPVFRICQEPMLYYGFMMATAIEKRVKHRPTYPQLHQLILDNHGNLSHVGAECGYSTRSVEQWIKDANEPTRLGLLEAQAKGKAAGNVKRLLEIKTQRLKQNKVFQ